MSVSPRRRRLMLLALVLCLVVSPALPHPNESAAYGMRSLVRLSDKGLHTMVILEIPITKALNEFQERFIETGLVDRNNIGEEQTMAFKDFQCDRLAEGLTIKINDETPKGEWLPVETPINGKANEGFFFFLVWFKLEDPKADFGQLITVEIDNQGFQDLPMYLSGYADSRDGWVIRENNAEEFLGEDAKVENAEQNPGSWTKDERMRKLRVVYTRGNE